MANDDNDTALNLTHNGVVLDELTKRVYESAVVQYKAVKSSNDLIYCLRKGQPESAPVLFLYGGNGLPYGSQILQHLDMEQPVYCTVGPELLFGAFPANFADRVSSLVSTVRAKFGDKLVHFVGYSFGGVSAVAICGEYQQNNIPFTITLLDPTPILALANANSMSALQKLAWLVSKKNVSSMSALQNRAKGFDAQLGVDLKTKVDAGEITDQWQLDVEMLRLVGNDQDWATMMRATVEVSNAIGRDVYEIVEGRYDFQMLKIPTSVFILDDGLEWFKAVMGQDFHFDDSILKDGRYGWASQFTDKVERIDVKGSHMDFWKYKENVKLLAVHLQRLIETDDTKNPEHELSFAEEVRECDVS